MIRAAAGGAVMETDLPAHVIDAGGRFTLILDEYSSSWGTASRIAKIINDSESNAGEILATAIDGKNILVTIPASERDHPDSFIGRIQQLPVQMIATKARVTINQKTGTIIMTGDVEISPVVISHNGLSISTVMPPPQATPRSPDRHRSRGDRHFHGRPAQRQPAGLGRGDGRTESSRAWTASRSSKSFTKPANFTRN